MSTRTPYLLILCLLVVSGLATAGSATADTKLLRFPDLHGDQVVFTYGGDLWLASDQGGTARRLTTHPGLELFARFSPDGQWIAFTGQYDGDEQVYVVPTQGGMPQQLTFYPALGPLPPRWGYDNHVHGWTPDGKSVLFRSLRDGWDLTDSRLYTVSVDGGLPTPLTMPVAGAGDLSGDGQKVAYSPLFRDFRHWKRYEGGWAQDLHIFDLESNTARQITDHPRSDRDPMWIGDHVYFASDRDGTLNLYRFDPASGGTEQLTRSDAWDLRWPSADPSTERIVYEKAGGLEILDTATGNSRALSITVPDDGVPRRPGRISVADQVEGIGLAPKGKRALFVARGDVFTVPAEHGPVRNLTRSSDAHDREASWSPDGETIAFVSDASGEEELYLVDHRGDQPARQLTEGSEGRYYGLNWSPKGTHIAYRNQKAQLFVVDVDSKDVVQVADDLTPFGLDYSWSPDGSHLAISLADTNSMRSIHLWKAADQTLHRVTGEQWSEGNPVWGPGGEYLYYLSSREFAPRMDVQEWNYANDRNTLIYALALRKDVPHPFPPRSDEAVEAKEESEEEEKPAEDDDTKGKKGKKGKKSTEEMEAKDAEKPMVIDLDGLAERVARVPVNASNYFGLSAIDGHLLYIRGGSFFMGRGSGEQPELFAFSFESREEKSVAKGLRRGALAPDDSKMLIQTNSGYEIIDPKGGSSKNVSTSGLRMDRVPAEEWAAIFDGVWRRFRDFFYVENMHGYDWEALREQYRPLLEHVAHRSDLNYVMSEMIAELNVSHAYVSGGDYEIPDRPRAALLGARFELDGDHYRVSNIFPGHNQEDRYRSPLTEVGVDIDTGDYVLKINGEALEADGNPFQLLRHAGGGPVELLVNDSPSAEGARRVLVNPISDEDDLLYLGWVEDNRRRVAEASEGRLGYLHIPDMGPAGLREFVKWYYGQVRKEGLVIDVRSNGGGNVSQMILERLRRELLMVDFERNNDAPDTYPNVVFHGHLVCLLDEDTASDGDQFAYVFKESGLGPLIGKRSWGGVVGIYGRGPLLDGGGVNVPEAGSTNPDGEWVIEGHGVEPDIEVDNTPESLLAGRDLQLEKAVEVLLDKIAEEPVVLPERPAGPDKTR